VNGFNTGLLFSNFSDETSVLALAGEMVPTACVIAGLVMTVSGLAGAREEGVPRSRPWNVRTVRVGL
jgi:hypothetical protein